MRCGMHHLSAVEAVGKTASPHVQSDDVLACEGADVPMVDPFAPVVRVPVPKPVVRAVLIDADDDVEGVGEGLVLDLQDGFVSAVASSEEPGEDDAWFVSHALATDPTR